MAKKKDEKFNVILKSDVDDLNGNEATIITTAQDKIKKVADKKYIESFNSYDPMNNRYASLLDLANDKGLSSISFKEMNRLAINPQSHIEDIEEINSVVRQYINRDDIIGKTYETIESNVNTSYRISYKDFSDHRNKKNILNNAKDIIENFNNSINVKSLIRSIVPTTYAEGNYFMYLRHENNNYIVDYYPIGIVFISDYEANGEPYLIVDMQKLINSITSNRMTNRLGKSLFFNSLDEEIKKTYPAEIYNAYKNREKYAVLDIRYSGVIRTNNMNRKYGLTPIFRALKSAIMLETFDYTDLINSKAKAKKIIHQTMRKEIMGNEYSQKGLEDTAYAHDNLMHAWKQPTVIVTTPPSVESIEYVEPNTENVNSDTIQQYRNRELLSLGITFLASDKGQTVTTANVSIKELVKTIDKITEQIAMVLNKWYNVVLADNGISEAYAPTVSIGSSEELSLEMKQELTEFLFCKLGCSYDTAYSLMNINVNDEKQKRVNENEQEFENIFKPRPNSYTYTDKAEEPNADNEGGRPESNPDENKKIYDKTRNKAKDGKT